MSFWNQRYSQQEYAYGTEPNAYFREALEKISGKKILFAAEGEGRNAVFAASQDWEVTAFDLSTAAKEKAEALALKNAVKINHIVSDLQELELPEEYFDALVLVFAHFAKRADYHRKLARSVKQGGWLILEAFNKCHINHQAENPAAGGPKDINMLYDLKDLKRDFHDFELKECYQTETELHEGLYHRGRASVVRILGRKKYSIMKRNMGTLDKTIRITIAALIAVLYFTHVISGTLALVLGAIAVIFVLTSLVSFCPLYYPFGIKTCRKNRAPHS